ncbi:zf-CHY-domain-containing protein, partial [Rhizodiscina lignyota]
LPADDGMSALRKKIHEIRDMAASSEEKARRLHFIMTESYIANHPHLARAQSPASIFSGDRPFTPRSPTPFDTPVLPHSPDSMREPIDPANPFNVTEADKQPCFRPPRSRRPSIDYDDYPPNSDGNEVPEPEEPQLGCRHYKRNVKIQCYDCRRWYPCRHCHDEKEMDHSLQRRKTENMLCMLCQTPQSAGEYCKVCEHRSAYYYCDICKLWDDDASKRIYHCADCGICRRGEGIGKDFVHCKKCNICIAIASAASHRCIERAAECDCPICGDYMFTSSSSIVAMPCGHYLHKTCYTQYMETAYKCPICKKSAVNMELQWRKLEHAIDTQPMPEQFRNTRVVVQCNDCSAKSSVKYHWLGNKCGACDSYNTNEVQILGPASENGNAGINALLDRAADA